ncbi:MAG: MerC domain-containing protein [Bacteroidota bacterium]
MDNVNKVGSFDIFGASVSALCAIHCTLTPLFFAAKPLLDTAEHHHHHHGGGLWGSLDYIFLVLSVVAVWYSSRQTSHKTYKWMLWAAWGLFAAGLLLESLDLWYIKGLMYLGSAALVVIHLQNYRHCQHVDKSPA